MVRTKTGNDLKHALCQLKSGKTRGKNPRDLGPDEIQALEGRREELKAKLKAAAANPQPRAPLAGKRAGDHASCPPAKLARGNDAQARRDYEAVAEVVAQAMAGMDHLRPEHAPHIAKYLGHLVAASFQSKERQAQAPRGYDFLPQRSFPHPTGWARERTPIAREVAQTMGDSSADQIFGLILFRFHNTREAWKSLREPLGEFARATDAERFDRLLERLRLLYPQSLPFSKGDGRPFNRNGAFVLKNLANWRDAALVAAEALQDPRATPETWHAFFLASVLPKLPGWGFYWAKFLYGDIGQHVAPHKCDLARFSVIGPGCSALLRSWGLRLPKTERAAQKPALEVLRELRLLISAVFDSKRHAGLEAARARALLQLPTVRDLQVQACECKRGYKLNPQSAAARKPLPRLGVGC